VYEKKKNTVQSLMWFKRVLFLTESFHSKAILNNY